MALFCLIRSSKQALIKKQLLTSPLRHAAYKHTHRYKHKQTKTRLALEENPALMAAAMVKVSPHLDPHGRLSLT